MAAVLGIVGEDPDMDLAVLERVTKEDLPVDIDFWQILFFMKSLILQLC